MSGYHFRSVGPADMPMLRKWLGEPEVRRWWGDPAEQAALIASDLPDPRMSQWIVSVADAPFAYVQHYRVESWPQPQFERFPSGTIALDPFIGEGAYLGAGHGQAFLRQLAGRLLADGAPCVVIDPEPDNLRARAAYRAAGFVGETISEASDGSAVVMTFTA